MATSVEYMEFVCGQLHDLGEIRYKKMFGEYMVYADDKPVLLVCNNTVYVKMLEEIKTDMGEAETGCPYNGAKDHYVLDIDNAELAKRIVEKLKEVIPVPKPKKKKAKTT